MLTYHSSEGESPATRWKWNETIGPVENRPGRQGKLLSFYSSSFLDAYANLQYTGDWTYPNTDALGKSSIEEKRTRRQRPCQALS